MNPTILINIARDIFRSIGINNEQLKEIHIQDMESMLMLLVSVTDHSNLNLDEATLYKLNSSLYEYVRWRLIPGHSVCV